MPLKSSATQHTLAPIKLIFSKYVTQPVIEDDFVVTNANITSFTLVRWRLLFDKGVLSLCDHAVQTMQLCISLAQLALICEICLWNS